MDEYAVRPTKLRRSELIPNATGNFTVRLLPKAERQRQEHHRPSWYPKHTRKTHAGEICQVIASESSESKVNDSMTIHSIDPQDG